MPSWVEPQLATLTRERFSSPEWVFERKLDGERCLAFAGRDGVALMSRSQHDITATFPEIAAALTAQHHGDLVVDGEIVAFDGAQTRFGRLQQRLGVAHPGDQLLRDFPVFYYLFDLLHSDGVDTRPLPLIERKRLLAEAVTFRDPLRFTEHRERDGEAFFLQACRDGWEGLVAKRADAPYSGHPQPGLAEVQMRERPGIRDRRLHRSAAVPRRVRRAASGLLRLRRQPGVRREGRHRLR